MSTAAGIQDSISLRVPPERTQDWADRGWTLERHPAGTSRSQGTHRSRLVRGSGPAHYMGNGAESKCQEQAPWSQREELDLGRAVKSTVRGARLMRPATGATAPM